jgi:hypothetical protein
LSRDINDIHINITTYQQYAFNNFDAQNIFQFGKENMLSSLGIRTFAWRLYLGIIPAEGDQVAWMKEIQHSRVEFQKLWKQYEAVCL